jgi:hypothetical protein
MSTTRESETWRDLGALGAGIGIGFFVYLFVGLGGGFGGRLGRGDRGSAPRPSTSPASPALPPRPRDSQPLAFVMTRPPYDAPSLPMEFRLTSEPGDRPHTLEELIARVRAGGRQDVSLNFAGDVRHASTETAVTALRGAGLEVLVPAEFQATIPSAPRVSGRGWYGERRGGGRA